MEFSKYQHVERLGTTSVEGILDGDCHVFPKIDGTNGSVWMDDGIKCGSRNRELTLDSDNAGFFKYVESQAKYTALLTEFPTLRLYGEWLVPHSLKTYREDAWRKFYVFDVMDGEQYVTYNEYKPILDEFDIEYIPAISIIHKPTIEQLQTRMECNNYLMESGIGEGIVIKNYDYVNKYGRITWGKLVANEFKDTHGSKTPTSNLEMPEEDMVAQFLTKAMTDKVIAKIIVEEGGWESRYIPKFLGMVWNDFINEELFEVLKKFKNPTINFKALKGYIYKTAKELGGI